MPSKKRTSKKLRAKKLASKEPVVRTAVPEPVKPVTEPVAARGTFRWEIWIPLFVLIALVVFLGLNAIGSLLGKTTSSQQTQGSDSAPSALHVVPEQQGGTSSPQASGALQPQPAGLQQAQPSSQSAGGLNLQAQTPPSQAPIR